MGLLSSLYVKLSADSAELTKEFKKTNKQSSNWAKDVSNNARFVSNTIKAVIGIEAVSSLASFGKAHLDAADGIARLSASTKTSAAFMQSFQFAGQLARIEIEKINDVTLDFTSRLGEATQGTGEAAEGFRALNLDAKGLAESGVESALLDVFDALNKVDNASQRNFIADSIFGDAGLSLVARDMAAGIRSAREELDSFGALLTEVDVAQVQAANDTFLRLEVATSAVGRQLTVAMAPALQGLAELFLENAKQAGGLRDVSIDMASTLVTGLGWVGDRVNDLKGGFQLLYAGILTPLDNVAFFFNKLGVVSDETAEKIHVAWADATNAFWDYADAQSQGEKFSDRLKDRVAELRSEFAELAETAKKVNIEPGSVIDVPDGKGKGKSDGEAANEASFHDAQIISFQNYKQSLIDGHAEIEESFKEHEDARYAILIEGLERKAISEEQYTLQMKNVRIENEEKAADIIKNIRSGLNDSIIGFLGRLGQKQKIFAKAAIVLEAARSSKEAWQKTQVAAIQAYSSQLIPGDLSSIGRATIARNATLAMGAAHVGVILANASLDLGGGSTGGGGGSVGGTGDTGGQTVAVERTDRTETTNNNSQNVVVIMSGGGEATQDDLDRAREQLRELTSTGAIKLTGSSVDDMKLEVV